MKSALADGGKSGYNGGNPIVTGGSAVKPMRSYGVTAMGAAVWVAVLSMGAGLCAQEAAAPRHTGVPQDWSQGHIVFSRDALARHPELIYREPRILYQAMQRWQAPNSIVSYSADPLPASVNDSGQRDWNLLLGSKVIGHMYPAKFSFDPAAKPDCVNDFVVFGMVAFGTPGASGGQANLVALNNLYVNSTGTGFCTGLTAPTVLFAYNITTVTGGRISTSPVLSEDGTKIAFVESVPGRLSQAIFHVLTWTRNQGLDQERRCAGVHDFPEVLPNRQQHDLVAVDRLRHGCCLHRGSNKGQVYKITGVFKGTPALPPQPPGPWRVTVHTNFHITAPVLDAGRGVLMVGSSDGELYKIDTTTGQRSSLVVGRIGGSSSGIVAPPIVDGTSGTTFVVSAYGVSSTVPSGYSAVLVEANTDTMGELKRVPIGLGASGGTALNLYDPL